MPCYDLFEVSSLSLSPNQDYNKSADRNCQGLEAAGSSLGLNIKTVETWKAMVGRSSGDQKSSASPL